MSFGLDKIKKRRSLLKLLPDGINNIYLEILVTEHACSAVHRFSAQYNLAYKLRQKESEIYPIGYLVDRVVIEKIRWMKSGLVDVANQKFFVGMAKAPGKKITIDKKTYSPPEFYYVLHRLDREVSCDVLIRSDGREFSYLLRKLFASLDIWKGGCFF